MLRVWFGVRSAILSQSAAVGKIQASKDVGKLWEPPQRSSAQGAGESNMEGKARVWGCVWAQHTANQQLSWLLSCPVPAFLLLFLAGDASQQETRDRSYQTILISFFCSGLLPGQLLLKLHLIKLVCKLLLHVFCWAAQQAWWSWLLPPTGWIRGSSGLNNSTEKCRILFPW